MKKDDLVYLRHILDAIADVKEFVKGMTEEKFLSNKPIKYAVVRCLEVIGEASKHLSIEFRKRHEAIPWQDISNMRNKLIHNYPGVDYAIVWEVVQKDIKTLEKALKLLLKK